MKTLFIIGAGGHAKVVYDAVNRNSFQNVSFLVQDEYLFVMEQAEKSQPVESFESNLNQGPQNFICAIGSIVGRKSVFDLAKKHAWIPQSILHASSILADSSKIGEGSYIGARAIVNPEAIIGQNCIINTGAIVEHDCVVGDNVNISPAVTLCGNVKVSSGTLVGAGATILPGIEVGENCVIGAGAVVTSNVENSTTVIGVPACRI